MIWLVRRLMFWGVVMGGLLSITSPSYSHVPERPKPPLAKYGGIAKRAGDLNVELVRDGHCYILYLSSLSNRAVQESGYSAKISWYAKPNRKSITLEASRRNRLESCSDSTFESLATLTIYRGGKEQTRILVNGQKFSSETSHH